MPPPKSDAPRPITVPDHELVRRIGRGGYGDVWLARNIMGHWRAVKVVYRDRFDYERPYEREFQGIRRFEPISRLHDSQVDILHVGRNDAEGYYFYVMELADDEETGQDFEPENYRPRTLKSDLERHERFTARQCLETGLSLATALTHLHEHGLVHRDIKPSNVVYIRGSPKLADIGLIAGISDPPSFVGTLGFVPPEGAGAPGADIYALGRVLYEMISGLDRSRFPELPSELLPNDDPQLAKELNLVILRACAYNPAERHATARELVGELQLLHAGHSVGELRNAARRLKRLRRIGAIAVVIAVISILGYIAAARTSRRIAIGLANARTAEARALRVSNVPGRRAQTLAAIREAAAIRPSRELRDEAIAALALTDLGESELFIRHPPTAMQHVQVSPFAVRWSPDLSHVAWCQDDGTVAIMRTADQIFVSHLPRVDEQVARQLVWSRDNRYLAVSYDDHVRIWETDDARLVIDTRTANRTVPDAQYSPDNNVDFSHDGQFAVTTNTGEALFWDLAKGTLIKARNPYKAVNGARFYPLDSRRVVLHGGRDAVIYNWYDGPRKGDVYLQLHDRISVAEFSPDGRKLAMALRDYNVVVADARGGKPRIFRGHTDRPVHLVFTSDSSLLMSFSKDVNSRFWHPRYDASSLVSTFQGFGQAFSPTDDKVGYVRPDGIGIWPLLRGNDVYSMLVSPLNYEITEHLEFTLDGRWLISMSQRPEGLWIWDFKKGQLAVEGQEEEHGRKWLALADEGRTLVALSTAGLEIRDVHLQPDAPPQFGPIKKIPLPPHVITRDIANISRDGRLVALAGRFGGVSVVDLQQPTKVRSIDYVGETGSVDFSPDGRFLAIGSRVGERTTIVAADSLVPITQIGQLGARVLFGPDSKWLATHTPTGVRIWNTENWTEIVKFDCDHAGRNPGYMAVSEDGSLFAFYRDRGAVELIDPQSWKSLATFYLPPHAQAFKLRFSPDGNTLIAHGTLEMHLYRLPALRERLREFGLDWEDKPAQGLSNR